MSEREPYYLTTAIFYPSAAPGAALDVRGDRRRCDRSLPAPARPRDALPDRHGRALGQRRARRPRAGRRPARADRSVGGDLAGHLRAVRHQLRSVHPHDRSRPRALPRPRWCAVPRRRRRLQGPVLGLVLHGRQRVQDRPAARRRALPRSPDPRAAVARGAELLLPPLGLPGAAGAAVRRQPVLLRARALPQRGARLAARRPARLLHQPRRGRRGGSRSRATPTTASTSGSTPSPTTSPAPDSRTTRWPSTDGGRPTSTSSARTSPASIACTGRRCS